MQPAAKSTAGPADAPNGLTKRQQNLWQKKQREEAAAAEAAAQKEASEPSKGKAAAPKKTASKAGPSNGKGKRKRDASSSDESDVPEETPAKRPKKGIVQVHSEDEIFD